MKIHDVTQGSSEWIALRLGRPTASGLHRLITEKTMRPSAAADSYANELVAEWLLGHPVNGDLTSGFMERGTSLEDRARAYFELETGLPVETVGFCTLDDETAGCSPDGLVGDDGGLEIKCVKADKHVGFMLDPPSLAAEFRAQVQGSIFVSGRKWWKLLAFNPVLPSVIVHVPVDAAFQAALAAALPPFLAMLDSKRVRAMAAGARPRRPNVGAKDPCF